MNLLSKLNSSAKTKTIEPREIFMTLPSKAPGYGYPRDVQSEVWKKWFDIRNEKNVILKMNTGSGKTVVGLIMLQSCLNEEKGPGKLGLNELLVYIDGVLSNLCMGSEYEKFEEALNQIYN